MRYNASARLPFTSMRPARRKRKRRAVAMRIIFILLIAVAFVLFSASIAE